MGIVVGFGEGAVAARIWIEPIRGSRNLFGDSVFGIRAMSFFRVAKIISLDNYF